MATKKPNLSDLLRQEASQDKPDTAAPQSSKPKAFVPKKPEPEASRPLEKMTKAQLLAHIKTLETKSPSAPAPTPIKDEQAAAKNLVLTGQVKALEEKIAIQEKTIADAEKTIKTFKAESVAREKAIADAEKTIKTLKSDSAAKAKLEKELEAQKKLVKQLTGQVKTLEAQQKEAQEPATKKERTVEEDRALVLARISSYQANLQFPTQPSSSITEDQIGWFD